MKAAKVLSKTVLVTGCSSAKGKAVAIYLRRTGWDVYPTARSEADLKELRSNGFEALCLDLNCSSSINSCLLSLLHNCKYGVGALINNAVIAIPVSVEDLSRKDLRE
jgi:NADP-dependent 3-hydroxy acid dehydrogenase YdfG